MAIPYTIQSEFPGRISIKSEFLKYLPVTERAISNFLVQNYGAKKVKANKWAGTLTVEYDPGVFDPKNLLKVLDDSSPDQILQLIHNSENGRLTSNT